MSLLNVLQVVLHSWQLLAQNGCRGNLLRDFPTFLKSGPEACRVEFGEKAFGSSKLGKFDAV